jgi:hypothetical protein
MPPKSTVIGTIVVKLAKADNSRKRDHIALRSVSLQALSRKLIIVVEDPSPKDEDAIF